LALPIRYFYSAEAAVRVAEILRKRRTLMKKRFAIGLGLAAIIVVTGLLFVACGGDDNPKTSIVGTWEGEVEVSSGGDSAGDEGDGDEGDEDESRLMVFTYTFNADGTGSVKYGVNDAGSLTYTTSGSELTTTEGNPEEEEDSQEQTFTYALSSDGKTLTLTSGSQSVTFKRKA
jgi:hypothetical protein